MRLNNAKRHIGGNFNCQAAPWPRDGSATRARQREYVLSWRATAQSITDVDAGPGQRNSVTSWRYAGASLVAIDYSAQSERYRHDEHDRLTGKTIIVTLDGGVDGQSSA